jgi:SAM-dependent methyltransferase
MARLTLDMTAVRDIAYKDGARHSDAVKLLALAEREEVELGIPPRGTLADLGGQFGSDLAARIADLATRPGVGGLPQLARLSEVTFPGENLFPGYFVAGSTEPWDRVVSTWKTHERVIELGCGPGVAIAALANCATRGLVVGVDHSEVMIRQARRRNADAIRQRRVRLIHAPFATAGFARQPRFRARSRRDIVAGCGWCRPRGGGSRAGSRSGGTAPEVLDQAGVGWPPACEAPVISLTGVSSPISTPPPISLSGQPAASSRACSRVSAWISV